MADNNSKLVESLVDTSINDGVKVEPADEHEPTYRVYKDSKIPVSNAHGSVWKTRKDQIIARRKDTGIDTMFDEVLRYYRNDQVTGSSSSNLSTAIYGRRSKLATDLSTNWTETENIVFANVSALVPTLYAKNPDAEITPNRADDEALKKLVECGERLVDVLASRKDAPGISLRAKAKRGVVHMALYNLTWAEVGYVQRSASNEQALNDIIKIGELLKNAKTNKEIKELEGQLLALEEEVDLLDPAGPYVKLRDPRDVLVDPDCIEPDLSDAKFVMIRELLSTDYINARYGSKDKEGNYVSVYEPTHVLKAGTNKSGDVDNVQELINNFSLFPHSTTGTFSSYGYENQETFKQGCRTMCYKILDKVTRRIYLYADNNWKYPIWVWDDPYKLPNFFNVYPASWYIDPSEFYAKSEVAYYLDQQDAINDMNSELKKIRDWARGKIVYNSSIFDDTTQLEQLITGTKKIMGIKVDPNVKISDLISAVPAPSAESAKFFDTTRIMQAVDRISSVAAVQRGVEYKTNTTNKAIESYESQIQTRADEKMDTIEIWIGEILYAVLFLCFQFMPQETVAELIGDTHAANWRNVDAIELRHLFSATVVGGSSLKPTSSAKKQQALNLTQILGQFASASPFSLIIALRVIERAFNDDITITAQDWQELNQSLQQQGQDPEQMLAKLEQAVDSLPPQAKQALGQAIAQGVPIKAAVGTIMQQVGGNAPPAPTDNPTQPVR